MLDRTNTRKEAPGIQYSISQVLEPRAVKLVSPGFNRIILRALAVELYPGAARFHLELLYSFDRHAKSDRTTLALLSRVRDRNALDENILRKALGSIYLAPTITLGNSRQ